MRHLSSLLPLTLSILIFILTLSAAPPTSAGEGGSTSGAAASAATQPTTTEKCEHGVAKALCTRCNPKLAPVFKAKGDWCAEHSRAESQCVICHPELAKEGVK